MDDLEIACADVARNPTRQLEVAPSRDQLKRGLRPEDEIGFRADNPDSLLDQSHSQRSYFRKRANHDTKPPAIKPRQIAHQVHLDTANVERGNENQDAYATVFFVGPACPQAQLKSSL